MKTFVTALFTGLLITSVASAQTPAAPAPLSGFYVGTSVNLSGTDLSESRDTAVSLTAGYSVTRNIAVEATLAHAFDNGSRAGGQTGFVNVVAGMPVGPITPYVLAGAGVGVNGAGDSDKGMEGLWNVGAGASYNVTRNWQLDARYRYVDAISATREAEHVVSLGVNYKF